MQLRTKKRSLTLLLALGLACGPQAVDSTGGETHFLRLCNSGENVCGGGLSCICGVCTARCDSEDQCAAFEGSRCLMTDSESCALSTVDAACDVTCSADSDCSSLSQSHSCVDGMCRAPAGSDPMGSAGGSGNEADCENSGTVSANEVVLIGDSFFANSHQITAYLEDLARSAGVLQTGDRYRDHSRLTENALAFPGEGLLSQYQEAATDVAAKVVIMNGGGADVLLGTCDPVDESCPLLLDAALAFDSLLALMAQDEVADVVYVAYPDPQIEEVKQRMDALRPMLEEVCVASPVRCLWVDLRPIFEGNYASYILDDGFNPTPAGSQSSATAIWDAMQQSCVAQ